MCFGLNNIISKYAVKTCFSEFTSLLTLIMAVIMLVEGRVDRKCREAVDLFCCGPRWRETHAGSTPPTAVGGPVGRVNGLSS